jgi:hypothetical protein
MLETLRICTENARVSDKLLRSNDHPIRQQVLAKNIEQGRATAEKLLRRTDLDPEQLSKVRQAHVRLL